MNLGVDNKIDVRCTNGDRDAGGPGRTRWGGTLEGTLSGVADSHAKLLALLKGL